MANDLPTTRDQLRGAVSDAAKQLVHLPRLARAFVSDDARAVALAVCETVIQDDGTADAVLNHLKTMTGGSQTVGTPDDSRVPINVFRSTARVTAEGPADTGAVGDGAVLPNPHGLLFRVARVMAVGHLARDKGISRSAARDAVSRVDDQMVMEAASQHAETAAALAAVGPVGASGFVQWIVDHQDLLLMIAKIIMMVAMMFL